MTDKRDSHLDRIVRAADSGLTADSGPAKDAALQAVKGHAEGAYIAAVTTPEPIHRLTTAQHILHLSRLAATVQAAAESMAKLPEAQPMSIPELLKDLMQCGERLTATAKRLLEANL